MHYPFLISKIIYKYVNNIINNCIKLPNSLALSIFTFNGLFYAFVDNSNIENLLNKSKSNIAYTMLDLDSEVSQDTLDAISKIDGVTRVLCYKQ